MRLAIRTLSSVLLGLALLSGWSGIAIAQQDRSAVDDSLLGSLKPADDPDEPLSGFYNTADLSLVITGGNSAATTFGLRFWIWQRPCRCEACFRPLQVPCNSTLHPDQR